MSGDRDFGPPPIILTRLWEKTSGKGKKYLVGRLGAVKVLVMENRDKKGDDDATHVLMVAEAAEKKEDTGSQGNGGAGRGRR